MDDKNQPTIESDSLETADSITPDTQIISPSDSQQDTGVVSQNTPRTSSPSPVKNLWQRLLDKVNIYFILLIVVLLALAATSYYAILQNRKSVKQGALNTQQLTAEDLSKLAGTDSSVGDAKQTLTIESNALFNGGVLVKGNIDIAGSMKVGGPLSLPGLTVSGTANIDAAALKSLTVSGDAAIQGKVTLQNSLIVSGAASFGGNITSPQLTTNKLQLNGDLLLSHHLVPNGAAPSHTNGAALGGGGTSSNNGNDIAGTVTINTGNAAPAGCFVTLNFTTAYSSIPRVVISPSSSTAASIDYYVNRSANGFSICAVSDPPDNTSGIIFDYIVFG